ncbi:MAG: D-alanine--D-alanine ligase [Coriobacteriales bacterium]|jgi:D-alanine-D-alanine ligase|nr:D-alanine--D-alanine ligase [Coriobacteriales bacterium]
MKPVRNTDKLAELHRIAAAVSSRVTSVALLCGGTSSEREISLASANGVQQALEQEGFRVFRIDTGNPAFIDELRRLQPDVAFVALHGKGGEDGCIQGFLETLRIPYTHSRVVASALAMDKPASKILYQAFNLPTPAFEVMWRSQLPFVVDSAPLIDAVIAKIGLPCVVKPTCDGSSFGVSIPKTRDEFLTALRDGFKLGDVLLIEEFVAGVEVTVPVLGNNSEELFALPVIEIVPKNEFYDYESKYAEGGSEHIIPARISEEMAAVCQRVAIDAHRILGCAGVSRTDIIVTEDNTPSLIETNTIPGMTGTSLIPEAAKHIGITPGTLYRLLIHYALENQEP